MTVSNTNRTIVRAVAALLAAGALAGGGYWTWQAMHRDTLPPGLMRGNGRIEAADIDVATRLPGRVRDLLVDEGDSVGAGQVLGHMDVQSLQAQRDEALARQRQAASAIDTALAQVTLRESDRRAVQALVSQRESDVDASARRLAGAEARAGGRASAEQELDDDRARVRSARAALAAARAQDEAAVAAIGAARTQVEGARATAAAAAATLARIDSEIADASLVAPRAGRVQYRIAEPGEVLGAGGRVLSLVDLSDVHMTFFVPEAVAGRLAIGSEVRLVLDAAPQYVLPATVSYVASTAQFTPKTVETADERQKMMFRVKARLDRALLERHLAQVKTGLPGVAWVRSDPGASWPATLAVKVPQ